MTRTRDRKGRKSMLYLVFMLKKIAQILVLVYKAQCEFRINFRVKFCALFSTRLSKSKIWNLCKKSIFLLIFFSPRLIRLILDFFETL